MQLHIAKIQDIEKSISFLCDKFDETVGRIARLEEENETLRNENRCLRAEVHRTIASKMSFSLPQVRTNYGKFNIRPTGVKVWNSIDDKLKALKKSAFRKKLKKTV